MKTIDTKQIFCVLLRYNIEANSATDALDQVLAASPLKPQAFECDPIEQDEDD